MDIFDLLDESITQSQQQYFQDTPIEELHVGKLRPEPDSPEETELIDRIFRHYRTNGFPYPTLTAPEIEERFEGLLRSNVELKDKSFEMHMAGIAICNSFHSDQMYRVKCHRYRTAMDVFEDDRLFRRAILKWVRHGDCVLKQGVLKYLRTAPTTQTVSNFRPAIAKAIYEIFRPRRTLDFSAGWGARMLGAMAAGIPYVGNDPNGQTVEDNIRMFETVQRLFPHMSFDVNLGLGCAEDYLGNQLIAGLDLIFTSPPYFDTEKYSDDPMQSYLRYPTLKEWYDGFLRVCIEKSFIDLEEGGHLVLNVNPSMGRHTLAYAKEAGFVLEDTWNLNLSLRQYNKKHGDTVRQEPIFVFRKGKKKPPKVDSVIVDLLGGSG